ADSWFSSENFPAPGTVFPDGSQGQAPSFQETRSRPGHPPPALSALPRLHPYILTAPAVRPWTMYRWTSMNSSMGTEAATKEAAISSGQRTELHEKNLYSPWVMGIRSGDWMRTRARTNCWLQPVMKARSEEHTSELQSRENLVCRLLLEKKKR